MAIDLGALGRSLKAPTPTPTPAPVTPAVQAAAVPAVESTQPTLEAPRDVAVPVPQVIEGPADFQRVLDAFDHLASTTLEFDELTIPGVRRYVMDIMVALKTNPEYDGILVARDVHNVMKFIRASKQITEAGFVVTAKKREKKEAAKKNRAVFDMDMLGDLSLPENRVAAGKARKRSPFEDIESLDAFASLDTDTIEVRTDRGKK